MILCVSCHETLNQQVAQCPMCAQETMLQGRFVLESVLGHGASGTTYRGRDTQTGQTVAIKELSLRRVESFKAVELFEREVATLRALQHEGIPAFVASATVERPGQICLYLVQAYIDGQVLALGGNWDEASILKMIEDLAHILVYLHARKPPIIHRDIKPSNLMRRADGRLVLIDFGAVRQITRDVDGQGSTVAGTFGYMAPEQLRGVATPASDLYAVGATAVALFSGHDAAKIVDPIDPSAWRRVVRASPDTIVLLGRLLQAAEASRMCDAAQLAREAREIQARLKQRGGALMVRQDVGVVAPVQEPVTALTSARQAELVREMERDLKVMRRGDADRDVLRLGFGEIFVLRFLYALFPLIVLLGVFGMMNDLMTWKLSADMALVVAFAFQACVYGALVGHVFWRRARADEGARWHNAALSEALRGSISSCKVQLRLWDLMAKPAHAVGSSVSELRFLRGRDALWQVPFLECAAWKMGLEIAQNPREVKWSWDEVAAVLGRALEAGRARLGAQDVRYLDQLRRYSVLRVKGNMTQQRALAEREQAERGLEALEREQGRPWREILASDVASMPVALTMSEAQAREVLARQDKRVGRAGAESELAAMDGEESCKPGGLRARCEQRFGAWETFVLGDLEQLWPAGSPIRPLIEPLLRRLARRGYRLVSDEDEDRRWGELARLMDAKHLTLSEAQRVRHGELGVFFAAHDRLISYLERLEGLPVLDVTRRAQTFELAAQRLWALGRANAGMADAAVGVMQWARALRG